MLATITIRLERRPHPYPDDPDASLQCWGRFEMVALAAGVSRVLCEIEWDMVEFADWFSDHQAALCSEQLADDREQSLVMPGESLAQALQRLLELDVDDDDELFAWATRLFQYRTRHVLNFAMRGSILPPITLGCNGDTGEISLEHDGSSWAYRCDMPQFMGSALDRLRGLIEDWLSQSEKPASQRATDILDRLQTHVLDCCREPRSEA